MSETTELTLPERAALALGTAKHEQELIELATQSKSIVEVKNKDAREQCHRQAMVLKTRRTSIRKAGKDARDDATKFSKAVIVEEDRLVAIIEPDETRLFELRDKWDEAEEAVKQAKLAAEAERIRSIKARIERFMLDAVTASDGTSAEIDAHATRLSEMVISLEEFMEFSGDAQVKRNDTVKWLRERQEAQLAVEQAAIEAARQAEADRIERERVAEANRIEAQRLADLAAELDRQATEARAKQAEADRQAQIAREAAEAKLRAEREAHEAALRKQREEEEARLRAAREAEEAMLAEQRAELARQQAEIDQQKAEAARIEREAREAAEREAARLAQEEADRIFAEQQRIAAEQAAEAERRERERQAEVERAALAAEVARLHALQLSNDGLGMLEDVLSEIARPIGQECCGMSCREECCGTPIALYHDIESLSTELNKWRNEIIERRQQKEAA